MDSSSKTYDPDTIKFPLSNPVLRLSVSTERFEPTTGLLAPLDIYAERFDLTSLLTVTIDPRKKTKPSPIGIFTHELKIPAKYGVFGFSFPGSDGDEKNMDGAAGGHLSLYVENVLPSTAKRLTFREERVIAHRIGLTSKAQTAAMVAKGGGVKIIFDTLRAPSSQAANEILGHLDDGKKVWPQDFHDDAARFVQLLSKDDVVDFGRKLPLSMKSVEAILKSRRLIFRFQVHKLTELLGEDPAGMPGDILQNIQVASGDRGSSQGNVYKDKQPPLWKAYRDNASRLCTVENGSEKDEPYAIKKLRAIREEAVTTSLRIMTGKDIFGKARDKVPRGSFKFYHDTAETLLGHLKTMENLYRKHLQESGNSANSLATWQQRSELLVHSASLNDQLIIEAKKDLTQTAIKIELSVQTVAKDKAALLQSMNNLDDFVKNQFGVSFEDFVSAMSSVLFTGGSKFMIGLQAVNLLYQGREKILQDDGVSVKQSYLIQKLHDFEGNIKELAEGYKVLKNGKIKLDDPGADKMHVHEEKWNKLVSDFRKPMNPDSYKEVKSKFDSFYKSVDQRNETVLHYNSILIALVQHYENRTGFQLEKVDIIRNEWNNLGAGHPALTGFLRKMHRNSIHAAQVWLYKQQQAFYFLDLERVNVIRDALRGIPSSGLDYSIVKEIQGILYNNHRRSLEAMGQPAQVMSRLQIPVAKHTLDYMGFVDNTDDVNLRDLEVKLDDKRFRGMYNVRLSAVRFYVVGAESKNQVPAARRALQIRITHSGTETFLDSRGVPVRFKHQPLTVLFMYKIGEGKPGPIKTDGKIALENDDTFARVGPFTKWKVDILRSSNPDFSFKNVSQAYLEFDFQYHALAN